MIALSSVMVTCFALSTAVATCCWCCNYTQNKCIIILCGYVYTILYVTLMTGHIFENINRWI